MPENADNKLLAQFLGTLEQRFIALDDDLCMAVTIANVEKYQ